MSKKQWMVLLMLFLTYLLLGASIFYHIESRVELEQVEKAKQERIVINALLNEHYIPDPAHDKHEILEKLTQYCGKSVYNYTEGEEDRLQWDFYNSFYFAYTVVSTIGYGNLAPTNMLSRILMIFYGLIGIPMNGILLTQLGEFFSHVFIRAHRKYKSYKHGQCDDYCQKKAIPFETRKVGLAAQIFMYLTPGFVMFIFFPAFLFSHYEGWTYDQAVYYAFVTLTTIGFGDIVAGQDNSKGSGPLFIMYKTFLICWISFGLGYIVMIMTFIARGMRSKKITRLEHKLAMNFKHTQNKIWNEFNKEVNYLRRVFNELQLSKVKRIYVDQCNYEIPPAKCSRSNSFPDLRNLIIGGFVESFAPPHPRRRANSEVVPVDELNRVVSETDLQRIDKNATFATHAMVQPAELLARLVNILGYIPPPLPPDDLDLEENENGCNPCIDAQTNQNDQCKPVEQENFGKQSIPNVSQWLIGKDRFPFIKPLSRAASEVRLQMTKNDSNPYQQNTEWTWSGTTASKKLQELIKIRKTSLPTTKEKSYKFPSFSLSIPAPKNLFPKWKRQFSNKRSSDANSNTKIIDKNCIEDNQQSNSVGPLPTSQLPSYLDERHDSIWKRSYYTHTGGDLSNYLEGNNLLEETSLADFLRALTALRARVGTVTDEQNVQPQRKLSTACLTPPRLPSLFTLFTSNTPSSTTQSNQNTVTGTTMMRSLSLKPDDNYSNSTTSTHMRRETIAIKPRRFSLRPVTTPIGTSTPPNYDSSRSSNLFTQRTDDLQEPYISETLHNDPFISVSPKEPLVNMERSPGISSPIKQPSAGRSFSIQSTQHNGQQSPKLTPLPTPKVLPRWKAGLLQRHIGQMNIRRRVRAFSLGDVNDKHEKNPVPLSPLALDNTNKIMNNITNKSDGKMNINQKTVTIISPMDKMNITAKNELQDSAISITSLNLKDSPWDSAENLSGPSVNSIISNESTAVLNKSTTLRVENEKFHKDTDHKAIFPSTCDNVDNSVFDRTLINLKDTSYIGQNDFSLTDRTTMQETNIDVKEVPREQNDTKMCIIDNLDDSYEPLRQKTSTSSENSSKSRKEKPTVPIDFYRPPLQVTIEKPAINPFEQYRAMTRSSQKDNEDLKEIRIDNPRKK